MFILIHLDFEKRLKSKNIHILQNSTEYIRETLVITACNIDHGSTFSSSFYKNVINSKSIFISPKTVQ